MTNTATIVSRKSRREKLKKVVQEAQQRLIDEGKGDIRVQLLGDRIVVTKSSKPLPF